MAFSRIFVHLWRLKDEDISVLHTDFNAVTVILYFPRYSTHAVSLFGGKFRSYSCDCMVVLSWDANQSEINILVAFMVAFFYLFYISILISHRKFIAGRSGYIRSE